MPIKVFLADDHAVVREGLSLLLDTQAGITVVGEAADGRKAVRQVERLCPDVVVMDIAMPGMNGIEATAQIRNICPSTQVVILSMHSSAEHILRALRAGALGYLLKESAGKELIQAVQTVYGGRRYLSRQIAESAIDDYISGSPATQAKNLLESLSSREREVLQLVAEGKSSTEIAEVLYLSPKTIETYRSRLMHKLGISDLPGLVKFAIQQGLITLEG
jgi:DNA-binding NarL/FixJ family response regulator